MRSFLHESTTTIMRHSCYTNHWVFLPFPRHLVTVNVFSLVFLRFTVEQHNRMCPRVSSSSPPHLLRMEVVQHHPQQVLKDVSEDEALDAGVTGELVVLPAVRPPHNDPASACSRSWTSSESRGRCRRPGRGGRGGGRTMGSESEAGLAALYTPENTAAVLKLKIGSRVLKLSFVSPFTVPLLDSQISWSGHDSRVKQISFYSRTFNSLQEVSIGGTQNATE